MEAGKEVKKDLIVNCSLTKNNETLIAQTLRQIKPDGIFCGFEKLAFQTYQVCEQLKLNIPEDIKIISFSNLEIAQLLNPSLSVIQQPAFEIGKTAANFLFQLLDKEIEPANQVIKIPSTLLIRRSST